MKISSVALAAIITYHWNDNDKCVVALKPKRCGGRLTSACLADSDPKYDADFPSSIIGQDERWKRFEGLWVASIRMFNSTNDPYQPTPYVGGYGDPYSMEKITGYYNHTIDGSRLIVNRYYVNSPAPTSFCEATPFSQNVKGNGSCGVNGNSKFAGHYGASTHENDGKVDMIRVVGGYSPLPGGKPYDLTPPGTMAWVDANTLQGTNTEEGIISENNAFVFIDNNSAAINTNVFSLMTNQIMNSGSGNMIRVEDKQEWIDTLINAYNENNVLEEDRFDPRTFNQESYPSPYEWCGNLTNDPSCTTSPYQEPDSNLNGGAIAGFTILGVAVFVAVAYTLHQNRMKKQKRRYRKRFIRNVARNITVAPTPGALSQDTLLKEFNHIDKDKGGTIEKEELKMWMADGKLGEISDADFNALWAAMDIDNSGSVDFIEFCTFLSGCGEAFDEVYEEQKNMTHEERMNLASRRLSLQSVKEIPDNVLGEELSEGDDQGDEGEEEV